ncbi:beta-ketoacyl-[acyl-carrier-protein] synthase family protein [Arcobacteraceae bacterium]|nr:beta-ketoacyl-[acyl-carrier-protein] synthase family protein [Arcobacteraceae bacterium]
MISQSSKKVYITHSSSCCCAGKNNEELFHNICNSRSGITQIKNYFQNLSPSVGLIKSDQIFYEILTKQIEEILDNSNLKDFEDTLLVIGSSVGGMNNTENIFLKSKEYKNINPKLHNINAISHIIEGEHKFRDSISFSTACTSSANAMGYAYEVLSKGLYSNVLVVGIDQISKTTVGGFLSLGVLSSNTCKPFDESREGMNVAEGIVSTLLQTVPNENCVELCGVGYSSDAHHMTHPHPDGKGAQKSMQNALDSANKKAKDIQYINAHGTGTMANDHAEANAIEAIFGKDVYVSSTKSVTGHTLGAAGSLEAVISSLVILNQVIPKVTNMNVAENNNILFPMENKDLDIKYVMSNSFAFGGNNCSLIFGRVK